jgi:hypothetical protein
MKGHLYWKLKMLAVKKSVCADILQACHTKTVFQNENWGIKLLCHLHGRKYVNKIGMKY